MKKQKDTFLLVCSMLLIVACLFSLFAGVKGFNDFKEIKEYKTAEKEEGLANIDLLLDGIGQLKENESAYTSGVSTYNAGLATYYAGQQTLAAGAAKLDAGEAQYAAGQQTLAAGQKQYNEGKATLDANTDAYNEGKQKLQMAETLVGVGEATGIGDPLGLQSQIDDGKTQLAEYEAGQAKLTEAEKSLSAGQQKLSAAQQELQKGYATYNSGVDTLNAGAAKLAAGKAQLSQFEDGASQVAYGMALLMDQPTIYDGTSDTVSVKGVADRFDDDFSYWTLNDDGSIKTLNGNQYLDLDNCLKVCKAGQDYIADLEADVTNELMGRVILYLVTFVICLLGAVAGIMGADAAFEPKRLERTTFMGMIVAVLALGANAYGLIGGYTDYTYPLENGSYSGTLQFIAIVALAAVAIIFAIVAYSSMANYKKALANGEIVEDAPAADTDTVVLDADTAIEPEAAPAETVTADPESAEKLEKLESQEAELKEMLASLSTKINDIKSNGDTANHQTV